MKHWSLIIIAFFGSLAVFLMVYDVNSRRPSHETAKLTPQEIKASGECLSCHTRETPGIVKQFRDSLHAKEGLNCLDCHAAQDDKHKLFHNGFEITRVVTSGVCAKCHLTEYKEFERSRHALPAWTAVAGIDDFTPAQVAHAAQFHPGAPVNTRPQQISPARGDGSC